MANYYRGGEDSLLFEELDKYKILKEKSSDILSSFGYRQVLTPTVESYDIYKEDSKISRDKMTKILSKDGDIRVLRPDATRPIVKMLGQQFSDREEVLKFYYSCEIYRENESQTKKRSSFTQTGIEYFGNAGPDCDAEVMALAASLLSQVGLKNIRLDINNSSYISSLLNLSSLNDEDKKRVEDLIDMRNQTSLEGFLEEKDLPFDMKKKILSLTRLYGDFKEVYEILLDMAVTDEMKESIINLRDIVEIFSYYNLDLKVSLDPCLMDEMGYYTGLIFQIYTEDYPEVLASGGRYDGLAGKFGKSRPACGFGANLSALLDLAFFKDKDKKADLLISYDQVSRDLIELSSSLRKKGYKLDLLPGKTSIKEEDYNIVCRVKGKNYMIGDLKGDLSSLEKKLLEILGEKPC